MTFKVYLSSRYDRRAELDEYARELEAAGGYECTSTWLNGSTFENTTANAATDIDDIYAADAFVCFSEEPQEQSSLSWAARGGRHVEFGVAFETGLPIIIVGPRENVFHLLPGIVRVDTWAEALAELHELATGDPNVGQACADHRRHRREVVRH